MNTIQQEISQRVKSRVNHVPLPVQAKQYAETTADQIYLQVWPLDAARLERALAQAFEAGWRAKR